MANESKLSRTEYLREYRRANREKINEYRRNWSRDNPEKIAQYQEKYWSRKAPVNSEES